LFLELRNKSVSFYPHIPSCSQFCPLTGCCNSFSQLSAVDVETPVDHIICIFSSDAVLIPPMFEHISALEWLLAACGLLEELRILKENLHEEEHEGVVNPIEKASIIVSLQKTLNTVEIELQKCQETN
jgi:hypothetical protein